jgi:transcriptional regulator with XRE-family HTH domain
MNVRNSILGMMMNEEQIIRKRYALFDNEQFKSDVADFKLRQGLTRKALADAAGMDENTYYMWMADNSRYLSLPSASALAAFCDLSLDKYIRIANSKPTLSLRWKHAN